MMKSISWILLVCLLCLQVYADETREQQIERLIKQLQDADSDVRSNAAMALGQIWESEGVKDAVPTLIQTLQDKNPEVRVRAASALVQIGHQKH